MRRSEEVFNEMLFKDMFGDIFVLGMLGHVAESLPVTDPFPAEAFLLPVDVFGYFEPDIGVLVSGVGAQLHGWWISVVPILDEASADLVSLGEIMGQAEPVTRSFCLGRLGIDAIGMIKGDLMAAEVLGCFKRSFSSWHGKGNRTVCGSCLGKSSSTSESSSSLGGVIIGLA